jgi:fructose-bisphosphate aldolase class I
MGTITKRFADIAAEPTAEARRAYREMLFTTPDLAAFVSGVILYEETLNTAANGGVPFPRLLADRGMIPGIKADTGLVQLAGFPGEQVTEGLDGLRARLEAYRKRGARFAKWRAAIAIGDGIPTRGCIHANAHALARYAAGCQEVGLVPIVEPEVLMDGDHTIERCEEVTESVLCSVFSELGEHGVILEGALLKVSMVLSGARCPVQAGVQEVAEATVRCLRRTVPASVPGVVFLSGGQSPELSTKHLNAMNRIGGFPWELSYCYGRALQDPARAVWKGQAANVAAAQKVFYHRASCNSAARYGRYVPEMEGVAA